MNTETAYAKCACRHCDNYIEFDTSHASETIACPHCGMDTILFVPPPPNSIQPPKKNPWLLLVGVTGSLALLVTILILFPRGVPPQIRNQPKAESQPEAQNQPTMQKQPVTGAFGFLLGQPLADTFPLETNDRGSISVKGFIDDQPPFRQVIVSVTPKRMVYEISATISGDDSEAIRTLTAMLAEKYGQLGKAHTGPFEISEFGDEKRKVMLNKVSPLVMIIYQDTALAGAEGERIKVLKDSAARTSFKGL